MPSCPDIKFTSPPTSLNDVSGKLLSSHPDTRSHVRFRDWLASQKRILRALPPIGDRNTDHMRWKLLQNVSQRLEALESNEALAWEHAKIAAGLYGLPDQHQTVAADIYNTGT